jgi:hypothetical protein
MPRKHPILITQLVALIAAQHPAYCAQAVPPAATDLPASGGLLGEPQLFAANTTPTAAPEALPPKDGVAPASTAPAGAAPAAAAFPKSRNVTINLINRMVQRGLLSKEDADELIKQAEDDAAAAREQAANTQAAAEQAVSAAQAVIAAQAQQQQGGQDPSLDDEFAHKSEDSVRVTYIPEYVRTQMTEEIKQQVMDQAVAENWASPRLLPDWVTKFRLFGDVRGRYEGISFPDGNDNTGAFPDFNAINTGSPFDVSGNTFSPQLNVDQDRRRVRLRVRVGAEVNMGSGFSAGVRVATGSDNSPVSTNQSLGGASGQGGNFSKYAIWLDRGYLKYEAGGEPGRNLALTIGRFDNPFFCSEVAWDDDIGFDGIALNAKYRIGSVTPFVVGGAFPVYNTSLNYATNQPAKFKSYDKWLYAVQGGFDWKINDDFSFKAGVAYYDFDKIEGRLSDPFTPLSSSDAGNTDASRPAFAQKGNTYMALRNIVPSALNNYGTTNQWQYFGLATPFRVLALTGKLDWNHFEPVQVTLSGEYLKNLAFDSGAINAIAVNNRGSSTGGTGAYAGGDTAWIVGLKVGHSAMQKRWDWNLGVNYRYVESDAVVDGFTDSDFGGGGTNVKGYSLFGNVALGPNVWLGARYMTSDEVAGPPLKTDIFQIDVTGKF